MLKNAINLIICLFLFICLWCVNEESLGKFGVVYETYAVSTSSSGKILREGVTDKPNFLKVGESVILSSNSDYKTVLKELNACVLFTETLTDGVNYYAYSSKLKNKINLNGKTVNLQIFVGEKSTVVGTPIILGSF